MAVPETMSFTRYLAAKATVDDRALNRGVWHPMAQVLGASGDPALRVLEVGAGVGTMVERLARQGLLPRGGYTAIDASSRNVRQARRRTRGLEGLELEAIELETFVRREAGSRSWDLVIASAFLDLVDLASTLPALFSLVREGGWFYFPLNFDGVTALEPAIDPAFDAQVEALYHRTMDERLTHGRPAGDSRTGRHLFGHLGQAGGEVLAAGGSDWVVFAGRDGYPADEAYFLHFILHTLEQALEDHPDLDPGRFKEWIARRHAQVEDGTLVYIAHQLDFWGRCPGPGATQ